MFYFYCFWFNFTFICILINNYTVLSLLCSSFSLSFSFFSSLFPLSCCRRHFALSVFPVTLSFCLCLSLFLLSFSLWMLLDSCRAFPSLVCLFERGTMKHVNANRRHKPHQMPARDCPKDQLIIKTPPGFPCCISPSIRATGKCSGRAHRMA